VVLLPTVLQSLLPQLPVLQRVPVLPVLQSLLKHMSVLHSLLHSLRERHCFSRSMTCQAWPPLLAANRVAPSNGGCERL
jgi:hypothetical protein